MSFVLIWEMKAPVLVINLLCAHLLCSPFAWGGEADQKLQIEVSVTKPEVFERVEMVIEGVPAATNSFDPDSIALELEAKAPSGKSLRVPGFFHQDFTRSLEHDREVLTPSGQGSWRVRWLALEPGRHTLAVTARVGGKAVGRGETAMDVARNDTGCAIRGAIGFGAFCCRPPRSYRPSPPAG